MCSWSGVSHQPGGCSPVGGPTPRRVAGVTGGVRPWRRRPTVSVAHQAHRDSGRRRMAAPRPVTPATRRIVRRGRSARPASNHRAGGSRRTTSTSSSGGGGSGGDSDLSDPSDPPQPGSLPEQSLTAGYRLRVCFGCGSPLDADRRSDAKWCPPPRQSKCRRLFKKNGKAAPKWTDPNYVDNLQRLRRTVLRVPPASPVELKSPKSRDLYDAAREKADDARAAAVACWLGGKHPTDFRELTRRVRGAGSKVGAAELLREWFRGIEHDHLTGVVTCRRCGGVVPTPPESAPGLSRINGVLNHLEVEMVTDGDWQPLYWRPDGGRTGVVA